MQNAVSEIMSKEKATDIQEKVKQQMDKYDGRRKEAKIEDFKEKKE